MRYLKRVHIKFSGYRNGRCIWEELWKVIGHQWKQNVFYGSWSDYQWLNTLADLSKMQIQFPAGICCFAKIQFQKSNNPSGLLGHEVCNCTQKYRQVKYLYAKKLK